MAPTSDLHPPTNSPHLRRGLLPGWLGSIWLHALVLLAASVGLRSCTGTGDHGEADVAWRTVGLVTRTDASDSDSQDPSVTDSTSKSLDSRPSTLDSSDLPPTDFASDAPPVDLPDLPGRDLPPVIGPGVGVPRFSPSVGDPDITTGAVATGPLAPSGLAQGETQFLGIRDSGETFVYVIDISGSMSSPPTAIAAAKAELMSSLSTLHGDQQFQVIFYNERPHAMRLPGKAPESLYDATDINRTLARQLIAAVQPDLGTKHMPALRAALELQPDVIFFLTDAEDPALSAKDLDDVRRLNTGGTRVHAVEFGKGANLDAPTALERLARANDGAYQYRDVTRLGR